MSLDYMLYVETKMDAAQLLNLFGEQNDMKDREGSRFGVGVVVSAGILQERGQLLVKKPFGIAPTAYLLFTLLKDNNTREAGMNTVVFGSIRFLDRLSADGVLDFPQ